MLVATLKLIVTSFIITDGILQLHWLKEVNVTSNFTIFCAHNEDIIFCICILTYTKLAQLTYFSH